MFEEVYFRGRKKRMRRKAGRVNMGTIQKTQRQETESTRAPPMNGPVPFARAIIAPKMPGFSSARVTIYGLPYRLPFLIFWRSSQVAHKIQRGLTIEIGIP